MEFDKSFFLRLKSIASTIGSRKPKAINTHSLRLVLNKAREHNKRIIQEIIANQDKISPLTCPISLFGTLDYGRLEVAHTRTIGWLLTPNKEHGFEFELILRFIKMLDAPIPEESDLYTLQVTTEKVLAIDKKSFGRADLFITYKTNDKRINIIIEAKIDSELTKNQISKYKDYLAQSSPLSENRVYALLLSEDIAGTEGFGCKLFNYVDLYKTFNQSFDSLMTRPGGEFLRLYLSGVAKDLLGINHIENDLNDNKLPYNILKIASSK